MRLGQYHVCTFQAIRSIVTCQVHFAQIFQDDLAVGIAIFHEQDSMVLVADGVFHSSSRILEVIGTGLRHTARRIFTQIPKLSRVEYQGKDGRLDGLVDKVSFSSSCDQGIVIVEYIPLLIVVGDDDHVWEYRGCEVRHLSKK